MRTKNIELVKSFSLDEEIEQYVISKLPKGYCKVKDIMKIALPLLQLPFEEKIKIFVRENTNNTSRQFKEIYHFFQKDFDELFSRIGIEKFDKQSFRKLVLFLNNKLHRCEFCGKITERQYCSRKCSNSNHSDDSIKKQRENSIKTMNERYNGHYSSTKYFREKIKTHYNKKYPNGHKPECFKNFENLNCEFVLNNFVENNRFLMKDMQRYFNCSDSFVSKFKKQNNILVENKKDFSKSKIQEELFIWIPIENKASNTRGIISPYELDIYLPDFNLAIEYNGSYWHSEGRKGKEYHLNKTELCNEKGIQLLHIFDFDDLDIWKSIISNKLGLNKKIYARKCIIKELEYKEIKDFLNTNHIQGSCSSKINLGLFYNGELVEVMTFGKPRFNKKYDYELLRLCSKKFYSVIGGASKLFKYFKEKYKGSIISYANRRFSNGNIYKQLGFKELNKTEPNYWYIKEDKILSRYQCQKHKLNSLLENFNPELSESENMALNGYFRIYDCGNIVYEFVSFDF